jgi:hypothetical protein
MESNPISAPRKAQLEALALQEGKDLVAAVDDVLALGLEQQQALAREQEELSEMLVRRYADAVSGKAALVDPVDARRELAARHAVSPHKNG